MRWRSDIAVAVVLSVVSCDKSNLRSDAGSMTDSSGAAGTTAAEWVAARRAAMPVRVGMQARAVRALRARTVVRVSMAGAARVVARAPVAKEARAVA